VDTRDKGWVTKWTGVVDQVTPKKAMRVHGHWFHPTKAGFTGVGLHRADVLAVYYHMLKGLRSGRR
jgi:hypothetical protein